MKNILLLAFLLGSTLAIGQTLQKFPSYEDRMFYPLQSNCAEDGNLADCWKIGLWWDSEESDYSLVHSSDVYFYYFPKSGASCEGPKFFKLTPGEGVSTENDEWLATWEYKDADISIRYSMVAVESALGYNSFDLKVTNHKNNSCVGPATGTTTF